VNEGIEKKFSFVNRILNFHFDGRFHESYEITGVNIEELNQWVSLAQLFHMVTFDKKFSDEQKKELYCLIEDLHVSAEVEVMTGGSIEDIDVEDICDGYQLDVEKYLPLVNRALEILIKHGVDLLETTNWGENNGVSSCGK